MTSLARWMAATLVAAVAPGLWAQSLMVRADSDRLRVSAPKGQFLTGRSLERLHNGEPVIFAIQLTLSSGSRGNVLARSAGRFALSFDIWEEKFAATRLGNPGKSASHLSAPEAEDWCLDSLMLSHAGLSRDAAFYVRLDVRAEDPDEGPRPGEEAGVTLAKLVELFSRPQRAGETRTQLEAGPLRLRDLR